MVLWFRLQLLADLKHQVCIRYQDIVNRFLTFVESEELER